MFCAEEKKKQNKKETKSPQNKVLHSNGKKKKIREKI